MYANLVRTLSLSIKKSMCVFTPWMTSGAHHPNITNFIFNLSRTLSLSIKQNICAVLPWMTSGTHHPNIMCVCVCVCACMCVCVSTHVSQMSFCTNITNSISCRESFRKKKEAHLTCVGTLDRIPGVIFVAESHEPTSFALCV